MKRKKSLKTIILLILAALLLVGGASCIVLAGNADVHSIENESVAAYIENVNYAEGDPSRIEEFTPENERRDRPAGYTVEFTPAAGQVEVLFRCLKGKCHPADIRAFTADGSAGRAVLTNLYPDAFYVYCVKSANRILKLGTFRTIGQVRMLEVDGACNVRDIGGWKAGNGKIRYGKIFRGSELNGEHDFAVTEEGIAALREAGIGFEIDLRLDREVDMDKSEKDPIVSSALGEDTGYEMISITSYLRPWTEDTSDGDGDPGEDAAVSEEERELYRRVFRRIFDCVDQDIPVYIHCWAGADRTGTVCLLTEGLLGMGASDLARDYELTTLAQEFGLRSKDSDNYTKMMGYIESREGADLKEKIEGLFLELGFTREEIDSFRGKMIA